MVVKELKVIVKKVVRAQAKTYIVLLFHLIRHLNYLLKVIKKNVK